MLVPMTLEAAGPFVGAGNEPAAVVALFGDLVEGDRVDLNDPAAVRCWWEHNHSSGRVQARVEARTLAAGRAVAAWVRERVGHGEASSDALFTGAAAEHGAWLIAPLVQVVGTVCDWFAHTTTQDPAGELAAIAQGGSGILARLGQPYDLDGPPGAEYPLVVWRTVITAALNRNPALVFHIPEGPKVTREVLDGLIGHIVSGLHQPAHVVLSELADTLT